MPTIVDVGSHATIHPSHSKFGNACNNDSNREYMVQRLRMNIYSATAQRSMILTVPVSVCSPCHLANYFDTLGEPSGFRGTEDDPYTGVWMQSGIVKCQIIPCFMMVLCPE